MLARSITPKPFGNYTLIAKLASGGMGTVYLAQTHERPSRNVAIKRIHEHLAEEAKFVRMFNDEARIVAQIDHPNVCGVFDFGEEEGIPYLAMPFLMGRPLSDALEEARTAEFNQELPHLAAWLGAVVCDGLHAAHELQGSDGESLEVVHRDVSPHNLFVEFDGTVSVLDFGVASARHRLASTATGEVKGKFAYMAPELLDGLGADRRADIWSLGVVLWEMVAGERLFAGASMGDTIKNVLSAPVPSLSEYRMDCPLGLEEVIFRALARDREARFRDAAEMAQELRAALAEEEKVVRARDLAGWVQSLFPHDQDRQQGLVQNAVSGQWQEDTPILPAETVPFVRQRARSERPEAKTTVHRRKRQLFENEPVDPDELPTVARFDPEEERRKLESQAHVEEPRPTLKLGLIALLVLTVATVGGWTAASLFSEPEAASAELLEGESMTFDEGEVLAEPGEEVPGEEIPSEEIPSEDETLPSELDAPPDIEPEPEEIPNEPAENEEPPMVFEIGEIEPAESETTMESSLAVNINPDEIETSETMEARPTPMRQRARGRGTVRVATPGGWAIVYADGRRLGEAPGSFRLRAGSATLEIQPFGRGHRIRRRVSVQPNQTTRVSVAIRR